MYQPYIYIEPNEKYYQSPGLLWFIRYNLD